MQIKSETERKSYLVVALKYFFFVISAMYRFSDSFGCDLHTYKPKVV